MYLAMAWNMCINVCAVCVWVCWLCEYDSSDSWAMNWMLKWWKKRLTDWPMWYLNCPLISTTHSFWFRNEPEFINFDFFTIRYMMVSVIWCHLFVFCFSVHRVCCVVERSRINHNHEHENNHNLYCLFAFYCMRVDNWTFWLI